MLASPLRHPAHAATVHVLPRTPTWPRLACPGSQTAPFSASLTAMEGLQWHAQRRWRGLLSGLPGADSPCVLVLSVHSAEKIVQTLAATPQYVEAVDPTEWSRVFYSSIFRLDRALRTLMFHFGERSGSTAIMSLVTPTHLIVGNVGTLGACRVPSCCDQPACGATTSACFVVDACGRRWVPR